MKIHLDFETRSKADLNSVGAYRYALDPSTRILIAAVAVDDAEPVAWSVVDPDERALGIMDLWTDPSVEVFAHNASFEHAVSFFRMLEDVGVEPPSTKQWRCSAVMARKANIPFSLAKAAEYLGLGQQKDAEGSKLIKLFSIPDKKTGRFVEPADEPEAFLRFVEYCRQDVRTERAVEEALAPFAMRGRYLDAYAFDLEMNLRGIPVDLDALTHAKALIEEESGRLTERFEKLTGLRPGQNVKVLEWFRSFRYPGAGMDAASVQSALDRLDDWCEDRDAAEALELRQAIGFAAVNKVSKMLECSDGEGRVRGCFFFNGASPGRWSAKLIQPQNFKRPSESMRGHTFDAFEAVRQGCSNEELRLLFGPPLEVMSSCIRHFIGDPGGLHVLSADYAAIEARVVCWLAGQEDALERFREKVDSYLYMASKIWPEGGPFGKESFERFVGKQAVLGCGYQMGPPKFRDTCIGYGQEISMGVATKAVEEFRRTYGKVSKLWTLVERAAFAAVKNPGIEFKAGPKLSFRVAVVAGKKFLVFSLPSGRKLVYPEPAIDPGGGRWGGDQLTYFGQIPFKTTWGRVPTYGGKLVENATQGTAFDLMAHGAVNASERGFEIFALIHDEALALVDPADPREDEFVAALTDLPDWAEGLPVEAEAKTLPYYSK